MLDLMLFNILIDDLFLHVKMAKLNAYADDHLQVYNCVPCRSSGSGGMRMLRCRRVASEYMVS